MSFEKNKAGTEVLNGEGKEASCPLARKKGREGEGRIT